MYKRNESPLISQERAAGIYWSVWSYVEIQSLYRSWKSAFSIKVLGITLPPFNVRLSSLAFFIDSGKEKGSSDVFWWRAAGNKEPKDTIKNDLNKIYGDPS